MPVASIIITTHNRPHLLQRAVESALAAATDAEVIVVDDASTDETASVCKAIPSITYVRLNSNQKVAGARNAGLLASRGEYVTFLDDDDLRLPDSVDKQIKLLKKNSDAGLIYAQAIYGDQSAEPTERLYPEICPQGDVFWELLSQNFIPCGTVVFRRSLLESIGFLDSNIAGLDDWDFWIRVAEIHPLIALQEPVMIWRRATPVSGQGSSHATDLVSQCVRQFGQRWMKLPRALEATDEIKRNTWQRFSTNMAAHLGWETFRSARHGNFIQATKNVFALLRLFPRATLRLARTRNLLYLLRAIFRYSEHTRPAYAVESLINYNGRNY